MALGHLKLDVVASEKNPADTLTKPLPGRNVVFRIREWKTGQNMLVRDGCSNNNDNLLGTNDGEHRDGCLW